MQMKRFLSLRGNAVDINARQSGLVTSIDPHQSLFPRFPGGSFGGRTILRLDMATGQQPPVQPVMVHKQDLSLGRMQHQSRAGKMPRRKLMPRKRRSGVLQKLQHQFPAFRREPVRAGLKRLHDATNVGSLHCTGVFCSWSFVQSRSGSNCSDFDSASRAWAF